MLIEAASLERLLVTAAHADEERVASGRLQNAVDAADVPRGVLEQDKVHGRVHFVVALESIAEDLAERGPAGDLAIFGLANSLGKVAENVGVPVASLFVAVFQLLLEHVLLELLEELDVLDIYKLVAVDSVRLVDVEANEVSGRGDLVGLGEQDTLKDGDLIIKSCSKILVKL